MKKVTRFIACLMGVALLSGVYPVYATEADTATQAAETKTDDATATASDETPTSDVTYIGSITYITGEDNTKTTYVFDSKETYTKLRDSIIAKLSEPADEPDADGEKEEESAKETKEPEKISISFKELDINTTEVKTSVVDLNKTAFEEIKKNIEEQKTSEMTEEDFKAYSAPVEGKIIAAQEVKKMAEQEQAKDTKPDNVATYNATNTLLGQKAADCKWDANSTGRRTSFNLNIDKDAPIKLEIFYTAGCESPQVTLISPNKQTFSNKGNKETEDFELINRKNQYLSDYSDLQYDVMYIYTTNDAYAGKWEISYSIDDATTETILVNAAVDDGWYDFMEEYKTNVKFFVLWYMDESYSHYTASDLVNIVKAEPIPIANTLPTATEDEPEKKDPYKPIIILIIIAILIGSGVSVYCVIKLKEEKEKQKNYKINRANLKLKKRQIKENGQLEKVLNKYEGDYNDDDYTEYIKPDKDVEKEDIPKRQFVNKPTAVADADYTDDEQDVAPLINSTSASSPLQTPPPSYIQMVPVMGIPAQPVQNNSNGVYFGMPAVMGYPLQTPNEEAAAEPKKEFGHVTPSWKSNSEKPNLDDSEPDWKKGERVKPKNNTYY